EANTKLVDIVATVQEAVDENFDRQEYFSWDQIGETMETDMSVSYFPLCFDFERQPDTFQAGNVTFSIETQYACVERFHVKLVCEPRDDAFVTAFHYDANLFQDEDIEHLADQYHTLIKSIIASPEAPIGTFDVLTSADRHQLLVEFNDTKHDYPTGRCIHHLIEEQVTRTPDEAAVIFENQQLTYAELNTRANQLAHYLQKLGVGPETLVGIMAEPSLEMMIGIVGILKAGGAYVPLDPEYPQERLAFILEDTQTPVLLTQERLRSVSDGQKVHVFYLDSDWGKISGESLVNPSSDVMAGNLAYAIYTSGSTGKPKGVLVSHENLVHSTCARAFYYKHPVGRYLLLSSFSFDSSVAGIFWTLIQGGALVLPPAGTQRDPRLIIDMIARHRVTHSLCLASHYSLILTEAEREKMTSLNTAIVSGEVFSLALVNRHDHFSSGADLYNEYGPTEASVWCIVFDCHEPFLGNKVPIGFPIANTQAYLLNSHLLPVPIGVPGEMYIGGIGVTRGYLNRPGLTADRFIPDPFGSQPGARLYKTGDIARYLPDGSIEFLGRMDDQVKIRGYRIELGEIEVILGQYPAVQEVAVIAREDTPGEKRLVAYVTPNPGQELTVRALRDYLSKKLPDYMVPSAYIFMDVLPRTPIGKLDQEVLPAPARVRPNLDIAFVVPRTPLEEVLAGIWAEVLDVEEVGVDDNFFELGGHSILVTQLASRVRNTLPVELPLRTLFEMPTVAGLAESLLQNPDEREKIEKIAQLMVKIAHLSEDEVDALLKEKR
ncbi:MAG: amino acid adenylation domain-containing protein, partial [Anaerolineales bacterium]